MRAAPSSFFTAGGNAGAPVAAGRGGGGGSGGDARHRIHTVLNVLTAQSEEFAEEKTK